MLFRKRTLNDIFLKRHTIGLFFGLLISLLVHFFSFISFINAPGGTHHHPKKQITRSVIFLTPKKQLIQPPSSSLTKQSRSLEAKKELHKPTEAVLLKAGKFTPKTAPAADKDLEKKTMPRQQTTVHKKSTVEQHNEKISPVKFTPRTKIKPLSKTSQKNNYS